MPWRSNGRSSDKTPAHHVATDGDVDSRNGYAASIATLRRMGSPRETHRPGTCTHAMGFASLNPSYGWIEANGSRRLRRMGSSREPIVPALSRHPGERRDPGTHRTGTPSSANHVTAISRRARTPSANSHSTASRRAIAPPVRQRKAASTDTAPMPPASCGSPRRAASRRPACGSSCPGR